MSVSKMEKVSFGVTGEFITNIARSQVTEDNWRHGVRILVEGLNGMHEGHAYKILRGDARLVGANDDIQMVEDDATEYKEELDWFFGHVFMLNNRKLLRPYGYVTGTGAESFFWARDRVGEHSVRSSYGSRASIAFANMRGLYYAKRPMDDVAIFYDPQSAEKVLTHGFRRVSWNSDVILCEDATDLPAFLKPNPDVEDAIFKAYKNGKMGAYGWRTRAEIYQWSVEGGDAAIDSMVPDFIKIPPEPEAAHANTVFKDSCNPKFDGPGGYKQLMEIGDEGKVLDKLEAERKAREAEEEVEAQCREAQKEATEIARHMARVRKVKEQADKVGGRFTLITKAGKKLRVPRNPFFRWALRNRPDLWDKYPWENVFHGGYKMFGDDPNHTDWTMGCGLEPYEAYDDDTSDAAYHLLFKIQEKYDAGMEHSEWFRTQQAITKAEEDHANGGNDNDPA